MDRGGHLFAAKGDHPVDDAGVGFGVYQERIARPIGLAPAGEVVGYLTGGQIMNQRVHGIGGRVKTGIGDSPGGATGGRRRCDYRSFLDRRCRFGGRCIGCRAVAGRGGVRGRAGGEVIQIDGPAAGLTVGHGPSSTSAATVSGSTSVAPLPSMRPLGHSVLATGVSDMVAQPV